MDMNFPYCLTVILKSEGGFVNNPDDPGGITNLGVTAKTYSAWVGHPATEEEMKALTPDDVTPIYQKNYWDISGCGNWPLGVDCMVFDTSVNQGPSIAVRLLQQAVGVTPDGIVGPQTIQAVSEASPKDLINQISNLRMQRYRGTSGWNVFGTGWTNRVNYTKTQARGMASEIPG